MNEGFIDTTPAAGVAAVPVVVAAAAHHVLATVVAVVAAAAAAAHSCHNQGIHSSFALLDLVHWVHHNHNLHNPDDIHSSCHLAVEPKGMGIWVN
jgi:glycerate kinase